MHVPRVVLVTRDCAIPTLPSGNASRQSTVPVSGFRRNAQTHIDGSRGCLEPSVTIARRHERVGPLRQIAGVSQELEYSGSRSDDLDTLDIEHAHDHLLEAPPSL